jgi:hypothetical protein
VNCGKTTHSTLSILKALTPSGSASVNTALVPNAFVTVATLTTEVAPVAPPNSPALEAENSVSKAKISVNAAEEVVIT